MNSPIKNTKTLTTSSAKKKAFIKVIGKKKGAILAKKATPNKIVPVIQYVLPLGNGWVVKRNTAKSFTVITETKREAVSIARSIAKSKHHELIVHGKNGAILIRENYAI